MAASTAPAGRSRSSRTRRSRPNGRTTTWRLQGDARPPRTERRLIRPLLGGLPAHPPVHRPDRARRDRDYECGRRGVVELVAEFGGINSSEHGDGLVRSEFNRRIFGDEFYGAMRRSSSCSTRTAGSTRARRWTRRADGRPARPGITQTGPWRRTCVLGRRHAWARQSLRENRGVPEDRQGVMCPSFMATRDEEHSTRGRANALVNALSSPDPHGALGDQGLHEVLDLCLECKACRTECPLTVDMAALKAEFLALPGHMGCRSAAAVRLDPRAQPDRGGHGRRLYFVQCYYMYFVTRSVFVLGENGRCSRLPGPADRAPRKGPSACRSPPQASGAPTPVAPPRQFAPPGAGSAR